MSSKHGWTSYRGYYPVVQVPVCYRAVLQTWTAFVGMPLLKPKYDRLQTPAVGGKLHQPLTCTLAKRLFGRKTIVQQSFGPSGFSLKMAPLRRRQWCTFWFHLCESILRRSVSSLQSTYISSGYINWKDTSVKFAAHEDSRCHNEAVLKMATLPVTMRDIAESL